MAKRLTNKQIDEIVTRFSNGKSIEELSKEFECTKLTISRNLKKKLGEKNVKELILQKKSTKKLPENKIKNSSVEEIINSNLSSSSEFNNNFHNEAHESTFFEIPPLNCEIESSNQKDLSSRSLEEISFPNLVYMIVDKKIELEIKLLKEYPDWRFLSKEDLNRKTIAIYYDLKSAKRLCTKDQRVIKVPNTNVFKIVAPLLISRGITRIISEDKLIAL